MWTYGLKRI